MSKILKKQSNRSKSTDKFSYGMKRKIQNNSFLKNQIKFSKNSIKFKYNRNLAARSVQDRKSG